MKRHDSRLRRRRGAGATAVLALGAALAAGRAAAQDAPIATAQATPPLDQPPPSGAAASNGAPAAPAPAPPGASEIMARNLIRLLVKQGVITQAAADDLIREAEEETRQTLASAGPPPGPGAPPPGVMRVPYVPEVVRNQIRDEVKQEVLAQATKEGWANPHLVPSWINNVKWFGDFRIQDQFNIYSPNNISPLIDYATLNSNGPVDINATTNPNGLPFLDTRANRLNQISLRARFGMSFKIANSVDMTFRLASGNNNGPVSTTQLLGGGLAKKDVWLDQAYITLAREGWGAVHLGRMPDPFMHTDILFSDNLNFDGVALTSDQPLGDRWRLSGAAGAFPLDYVASNFPTNQAEKVGDHTKWLFAAQLGAQYRPTEDSWSLRGAVAYYDFYNVKGQLSAPCPLFEGLTQCSTDWSRPAFMQKGNTLFLIRDILPNPNSPQNFAEPQFVGLSYNYQLVDANVAFQFPVFGDTRGVLRADYVRNLAYDPKRVLANPLTQPVTNFGVSANGGVGAYRSGPDAWMFGVLFGHPDSNKRGDWTFSFGYKYIEPDAVLDAFNDNDFHLGGTNAKGYFAGGTYNIADNTWIDFRWYSTNEVYGPPLAIDSLWLEMNTRF